MHLLVRPCIHRITHTNAHANHIRGFARHNIRTTVSEQLAPKAIVVIQKKDSELALALASPFGKVSWEIPVPGKTYIALKVPKPSNMYFKKQNLKNERTNPKYKWRQKIACIFYLVSRVNFSIAQKILGIRNSKV